MHTTICVLQSDWSDLTLCYSVFGVCGSGFEVFLLKKLNIHALLG